MSTGVLIEQPLDVTTKRGARWDPPIAVKQGGVAFNMTGYTNFRLVIVDYLTLTEGNGLTINRAAGTIQVDMTELQTMEAPNSRRWYLAWSDAGGKVRYPVGGTMTTEDP